MTSRTTRKALGDLSNVAVKPDSPLGSAVRKPNHQHSADDKGDFAMPKRRKTSAELSKDAAFRRRSVELASGGDITDQTPIRNTKANNMIKRPTSADMASPIAEDVLAGTPRTPATARQMMNANQSATKPNKDTDALRLVNMKPFKLDASSFNSYLYKGQMVTQVTIPLDRQMAMHRANKELEVGQDKVLTRNQKAALKKEKIAKRAAKSAKKAAPNVKKVYPKRQRKPSQMTFNIEVDDSYEEVNLSTNSNDETEYENEESDHEVDGSYVVHTEDDDDGEESDLSDDGNDEEDMMADFEFNDELKEEKRIIIVVKYPLMGSLEEWEDSFSTCKDEVDLYKTLETWKCPYLLRFYGTHGPGLVFEEVDGESLSDLLDYNDDDGEYNPFEGQTWSWSQLGEHITIGLHYLHKKDISHNDIKPENVRYSKSKGIWKLLDLGLATEMDARVVKSIGTDGFRAPEVAAKGRLHLKSDCYGMGVMMQDALFAWSKRFEFLKNRKPPSSGGYCGKKRPRSVVDDLAATYIELEQEMSDLVDRMLMTDPDKRPSILGLIHEFRAMTDREHQLLKFDFSKYMNDEQ